MPCIFYKGLWKDTEVKKETYIWFLFDLEKTYDWVPSEVLWKTLEKKCIHGLYTRHLYDEITISVNFRRRD